nr:hypothetical protein [uncultured Hyphomonas sp.]
MDFLAWLHITQAFQHQRGSTFGRHQAIGAFHKRSGPACWTQCIQRVEANVQDQIIGGVYACNKAAVYLPGLQFPAGDVDCVKGGRTRGIE